MFPTTRSSAIADLLSGDPERQARSVGVIAEAYWQLHMQPRDAWTHEMELRPWMETF